MKTREIKFRIWNGAEMVEDVTVGKFGVFYVNPTNNGLDPKDSASLTPFTTKYDEGTPLMQYTGLKDKNGKEIYEGDIVRYEMPGPPPEDLMIEFIEPIIFSVASFDVEGAPLYVVNDVCEVIGNIYENPELLKR